VCAELRHRTGAGDGGRPALDLGALPANRPPQNRGDDDRGPATARLALTEGILTSGACADRARLSVTELAPRLGHQLTPGRCGFRAVPRLPVVTTLDCSFWREGCPMDRNLFDEGTSKDVAWTMMALVVIGLWGFFATAVALYSVELAM
jgi:hypothetical protein